METEKALELYYKYKKDYHKFVKRAHKYQTKDSFSPELESLVATARDNRFVLYDLWPNERADPKVVFVLDPLHQAYEIELAKLIIDFLDKKQLTNKDCLLLEGPWGKLDYSYQIARKNNKLYFGIQQKRGQRMLTSPKNTYIYFVYEKLKENQIPVFYDDKEEAALHKLSHYAKILETSLRQKPDPAKQKAFENHVKSMMEIMLDRSDNYFLAGIRQNLSQRYVFQIFGFADYIIENIQRKLKENKISYAAFMPKMFKPGPT